MSTTNLVQEIPLKEIKLSPLNVRTTNIKTDIENLAESIKKYGLLQPVVLVGEPGKPPYELIVGQRRFEAHKLLGKETIRAIFHKKEQDIQLKLLSLSENMLRVDLDYADKAKVITELYIALGRNMKNVAKATGFAYQTVLDYVKIEEQATEKAKELLKKGLPKADVKRAINAAQGDRQKIDKLLDVLPKLTKYEKDRAVEFGKKEKATVEKIIEAAQKPKFEKTIILTLSPETDEALNKAKAKLFKDREEIASLALRIWLEENGFLNKSIIF